MGVGDAFGWLLLQSDPSSVCLNCHSGSGSSNLPHVTSTDGSAMTPGGDFYWLNKTFSWVGGSSPGERHGHNITAQDFGFVQDSTNSVAPGGTYPASNLGCTSCHDSHGGRTSNGGPLISGSGSYGGAAASGTVLGNYRLLGGQGYSGGNQGGGNSFNNESPVAMQNPLIPYGETDSSHVDYGSSMSEWCANCHAGILNNEHQNNFNNFEHPSGNGEGLDEYLNNYNQYVRTGDLTGNIATAYLALVPFERGVADTSLLAPTGTEGPDQGSNIMCLTCHRAHGSAFPYAGRWYFFAELVADSHPKIGDAGVTGNDVLYSYYGRNMASEFGPDQRILCEKCHEVPKDGYPPF